VARELEFEGEVWSAVLLGAATVGRGMGTGAQVLHLGFEAPVGAADPERTVYVAASRFEDVHDDTLRKLLSEATGTDEAERRSAARQS